MAKVLVDQDFLEDGLELICGAIRLKTGGTGLLAFPVEMKEAVDSIETGSGGITPTGTKEITENTPQGETVDVTTYAAVTVNVQSGADTSDATAAASDIPSDKTAYIATGKVTGTADVRTGADLSASGAAVTVPAGLYRQAASKSVSSAVQATPSVSVDSSTGLVTATASQSAGYVSAGTKSATLQLSAKAAQDYTPGTTDQEIPAGKYTVGKQTIKGDAKLVPGNIRQGVDLFGVTGTCGGIGQFVSQNTSITAQRVGGAAMVFDLPSAIRGKNLIGLCISKLSSVTQGLIETLIILKGDGGNIWDACQKSGNAGIGVPFGGSSFSVTNNTVMVSLSTQLTGFDSGDYTIHFIAT